MIAPRVVSSSASPRGQATSGPAAPLPGAPSLCNGHPQTSSWPNLPRLRRWVLRQAWAREVLRELRSFVRCSRTLLALRTVPLIDLGPESGIDQASGRLIECSRTRGRTIDIRRFHAEHPGATLAQTSLYLEGWNRGAEWAAGNPDSCTPHSDHSSRTTRRWTGCFLPK